MESPIAPAVPQITNVNDCTLNTCPLSYATVHYQPSLPGNAFFLGIFGLLLVVHALQLWRYQTWTFSGSMMGGLVLEIVGYLGRVQMHFNPFLSNPFLLYIICLTIGPVFFSAAIYIILSRVMVHYGPQHSSFSPKTVSLTFMTFDFIALVLQAVGGAIADTASNEKDSDTGTHIMVAGLAFQVVCLLLFMGVAADFALRVKRARRLERNNGFFSDEKKVNGNSERSFKIFLFALTASTIFILTRSSFRVAELVNGFDSKLANDQVTFMILEGAMITLATVILTAFHPGKAFGEKWKDAGWSWKKDKNLESEEAVDMNSQPALLK